MAHVTEIMGESKIQFLANEVARTYMTSKTMSNSENFMEEYYNFYKEAIEFIVKEEKKRSTATSDLSFDDVWSNSNTNDSSNGRHFSF